MRTNHPLRNLAFAAGLFATAAGLLIATSEPAWTDDVDLLRFDTGNPYLFIILDTSGSMNLPLAKGAAPIPGDGDAPGSRIYEAKKAMYNVFKDVDDVHFGLATYNQDTFKVASKHWLYAASANPSASGWPLTGYPATTDILTFGAHLGTATAGSCNAPLKLSTQRDDINRFSKLGADLNTLTKIWIEGGSPSGIYEVSVTKVSGGGPGSNNITVRLSAQEYKKTNCTAQGTAKTMDVNLLAANNLPNTHALYQKHPFEFLMYDGVVGDEDSAGTWSFQDMTATATLGSDRPFTGKGWEGNYDSTFDPLPGNDPFEASITNDDPYCVNDNGINKCLNLKFPTSRHPQFPSGTPYYPEVDSGDVLTLDWRASDGNKNEMLRRLAPNLRSQGLGATPDFGIASYFKDTTDFPNSGNGSNASLSLRNPGEIPLAACGNSPLGRAINDYRCWWNGTADNKCKGTRAYTRGFESLALQFDPEWGCRRPYLLLISDGEDNSTAESPNADVANLNAQAGIKTWAINLGDESACKSPNKLHSIVNQGKGECVTAADPDQLETELRKLLGQIREETRAFASAAVPSVQATVEDKIFLTNFTPIDGASVWDGHVHAFLKPLPLKDGRPNTTIKCSSTVLSQCHLWDAGEVILNQSPGPPGSKPTTDAAIETAAVQLGTGKDERRVIYAQDKANGTWTTGGRLFAQTATPANTDATPLAKDLWKGLGIDFTPGDRTSEGNAENIANRVVVGTLWEKQADVTQVVNGVPTTKTITYALGDIFHSNPLVVGSPSNTRYFADNLGTEGKTCAAGDKGYRCFFEKHEKRRKLLVMGSNDGMVHAIDAGQWDNATGKKKFNNGTGREVFAYIPRSVMPTVRDLVENTGHREWSVDGTLAVADFFLDPVHTGTPAAADREWRTVMLGGLREGGNGYFALDITQPDKLVTAGDGTKYVPEPVNDIVPSCIQLDSNKILSNPSACGGPVPFPAVLWEFRDAALDSSGNVVYDSDGKPVLLDEEGGVDTDGNGSKDSWLADLGETWSIPNLGRIKLCEGSDCSTGSPDIKDKFVMVFGGGMDPDKVERRGNYIYMVDIETGKVIYKRRLDGSAPSEPAAVDTDQDGYLDRIYIATTKGYLYRIDLKNGSDSKVPKLEQVQVTGVNNVTYTANRIKDVDGAGSPLWVPTKIFSTGGRPIYYRPSVIFVARLGRYALSFGTGDREDLWSKSGLEGRFYVFVDESDKIAPASLPVTETSLKEILVTSADVTNADYLLGRPEGQRGWFLRLNADERVITDSFALSGVSFFSSYQPDTCVGTLNPLTNVCTPPTGNTPKLCAKTGRSRIFIVNTTNANSFMVGADGQRTKYFMVSNFVTNPYIEQGATKNPSGSGTGPNADQLTATLSNVMEELKKLFPKNCRFANYRLDIKTISSDTGVVFIAPVPVCIVEKNWKEF